MVSVMTPSTGPVSSPRSMTKVEAPVTSSPAMMACCTGAAPRQAGSSEKCRLIQPEARDLERRLRDEVAVGDDGARVGCQRAQGVEEVGVLDAGRGQHRHAELLGPVSHGRGLEAPAATGRRVGSGDDADELVARGRDGIEAGHRRLGGAGEDDSHVTSPGRRSSAG